MNRPLPPLAALARLVGTRDATLPLLVARLPELERIAWRRGLRPARTMERRASAAFARAAGVVLRADDALAHDPGSDVFVAALTAETRGRPSVAVDARSALARIGAALEAATGFAVLTGWTRVGPDDGLTAMEAIVERALARGAQERERYAFFSAIGHELRTPLSSIRGYLETLLDGGVDAPTRHRFLRIAHDESLRMSRLIEGMFEISLLDMRDSGMPGRSGIVAHAVAAAHDACRASAMAHNVTLVIEDAPDVHVGIDTDRLTLVLVNLIDNAVKHGRLGGRVVVGIGLGGDPFVSITVDDDGPGVTKRDRERIFAMGVQGSTAAGGSGVGLALVRLMLERAGGRVDLTDSPLGGARFTLALPLPIAR
ncbi:MAG TPA: HAMP domain-containing sensor histidine kinase [Candidatus Elarobacter sp.]